MNAGSDPFPAPAVVLASASRTRASMLDAAGIAHHVDPARVDEAEIKLSMSHGGADPLDAAVFLAEMKAQRISPRHPDALVIGADQILECEGRWFDKPESPEEARRQLVALRGREHRLATAVCVARNGQRIWHARSAPRLLMRDFSDDFLDDYIDRAGDAVCASVGGYQLETIGVQLFSRIDGDYFAILGLPLLELADFLREHGVLKK